MTSEQAQHPPRRDTSRRDAFRDSVWDSDLPTLTRMVALVYADHTRTGRGAWVQTRRGMARTGMSRTTWKQHRAALVTGGWLSPGDQRAVSHLPADQRDTVAYDLNPGGRLATPGSATHTPACQGVASRPPGGREQTPQGVASRPQLPTGTHADPPLSSSVRRETTFEPQAKTLDGSAVAITRPSRTLTEEDWQRVPHDVTARFPAGGYSLDVIADAWGEIAAHDDLDDLDAYELLLSPTGRTILDKAQQRKAEPDRHCIQDGLTVAEQSIADARELIRRRAGDATHSRTWPTPAPRTQTAQQESTG